MYFYETRVRYSEVDENRNATLLSIINWFQDCCTFESEDRDVGVDWLRQNHTGWMLTSWQIKIDRRPIYCEHIKVTTWACGFRYFVGKRNFTIEDSETGELLVYAYSEWAYVNTDTGLPEKNVPQKEFEAYGITEPLKKEFTKGKIRVPDEAELCSGEPVIVTEHHLDTNHHVNNGQYIAIAMTALPDQYMKKSNNLQSFRAEYKRQSVKGDVLYPYYMVASDYSDEEKSDKDDTVVVILKDKEYNIKLISEFRF